MLYITYWELNPDFDPSDLAELAQKLLSKKLYPVEGTKEIGWYISTSDYWGISITEEDTTEQLIQGTSMWRIAKPGVFKCIKTTPAAKVTDVVPVIMKLAKKIKE